MKFIRKITWEEVYNTWRTAETTGDLWRKHYTNRGHTAWEEFRAYYINKTDLPKQDWQLYQITPKEIGQLQVGPFEGWQALAKEMGSSDFATVSQAQIFNDHKKIQDMLQDFPQKFPSEIQLIGIRVKSTENQPEKIVLFEGHHRAVAICRLLAQSQPVTVPSPELFKLQNVKITLALCDMDEPPKTIPKAAK